MKGRREGGRESEREGGDGDRERAREMGRREGFSRQEGEPGPCSSSGLRLSASSHLIRPCPEVVFF